MTESLKKVSGADFRSEIAKNDYFWLARNPVQSIFLKFYQKFYLGPQPYFEIKRWGHRTVF